MLMMLLISYIVYMMMMVEVMITMRTMISYQLLYTDLHAYHNNNIISDDVSDVVVKKMMV
jgi:hypothetical protein